MNKVLNSAVMALTASLFAVFPQVLQAETVAFYDFSGGTVGAAVSKVMNAGTLGSDYDGTASAGMLLVR